MQDTILSNFDFLHYTQTHCLKDQWWAFGPPLWAFGQILHTVHARKHVHNQSQKFGEDLTQFW